MNNSKELLEYLWIKLIKKYRTSDWSYECEKQSIKIMNNSESIAIFVLKDWKQDLWIAYSKDTWITRKKILIDTIAIFLPTVKTS